MDQNRTLSVGILAHVDAGKTTLSEGLLYKSGSLRKLGRVDHRDAFLDTDVQERERGITIFSKQAMLAWNSCRITLLDTPGHVDFSGETERALSAMDCAVLVIGGMDGVQGHTETLWKLLEEYALPVFIFVNKMDQPGADREQILNSLRSHLNGGCIPVDAPDWQEQAASCSEEAMEMYFEKGELPDSEIVSLVSERKLFPCFFGSALRLEGVEDLLNGLVRYSPNPVYPSRFAARVYKISRDNQGNRLTWMKITGGSLKARDQLSGARMEGERTLSWEEKVNQIRLYSGSRFQPADEVSAGQVCAVTGLSYTFPGEGLGAEPGTLPQRLEPVFQYKVILPPELDPPVVHKKLLELEEEDPQLHVVWNEALQELRVHLMGDVQLEILRRVALDRFGMQLDFGEGGILYRETIRSLTEGVGHYEPLRHYAEVHLLLEPGKPGTGLRFRTACSEDELERNWQRLVLTHLAEKTHLGVLTGSPITDMCITLIAGKAHLKHTEGGDFRQATYRAVRQGLMCAESVLLEPWYDIRLVVPSACLGRAMNDLRMMGGSFDPPDMTGEEVELVGKAPVSAARSYARELAVYTRGRGKISLSLGGYAPCTNQEEVVRSIAYQPEADLDNSPDSVFCAHGAGFPVRWDQVRKYMHQHTDAVRPESPVEREREKNSPAATDEELMAIFERTYGPIKRRDFLPSIQQTAERLREELPAYAPEPEYLLVDGYNILHAWEEFRDYMTGDGLDTARKLLMDLLANFQGFRKCVLILVFDAYRIPRGQAEVFRYHNIYVVYTREAETADSFIEKTTYEIGRHNRVRVATSDGLEQMIILGHGAMRVSATSFHTEVEAAGQQIRALIAANNGKNPLKPVEAAMEKAIREKLQS